MRCSYGLKPKIWDFRRDQIPLDGLLNFSCIQWGLTASHLVQRCFTVEASTSWPSCVQIRWFLINSTKMNRMKRWKRLGDHKMWQDVTGYWQGGMVWPAKSQSWTSNTCVSWTLALSSKTMQLYTLWYFWYLPCSVVFLCKASSYVSRVGLALPVDSSPALVRIMTQKLDIAWNST